MDGFEIYLYSELGLAQPTILAYKKDVEEFLNFIETKKLTALLIDKFINHLRESGLKPTTVRRKYMSIRCFCNHLISSGRLDPNILESLDPVRAERSQSDVLEPEGVDAIMATLGKDLSSPRTNHVRRNIAIVLTLYHCGLRVSELCGLNIEDLNFARRQIRVLGKGRRERMVPVSHECVDAIQSYLKTDHNFDTNVVFIKSDGQRLTRRAVSDMILSLSRRAGVKHTTSHTLRRSCATFLMNNGVDLELVKSLLGHQNLGTTQTYLAVTNSRLKNVHMKCHPSRECENET